jgi:cytochrome c556
MRRTSARPLLVAAALGLGLALLGSAGAADPATDAEFTALLEQDAKLVGSAAGAVDKAPTPKDKKVVGRNAGTGIKSSALIVATYANAQITGSNAGPDSRAAAVRDQAIKVYKAAADGNFKAAAEEAKPLPLMKAPGGTAGRIDVLKEVGDVTPKEVMHNFAKTTQFGTNVEADIIANAKKATAKPADATLIAHRVLAMGEVNKVVKKAENAAEKKAWDDYNDKMIKAAEELLATSKKKSSAADLTKAFGTVNARCNACHDDDKVGK